MSDEQDDDDFALDEDGPHEPLAALDLRWLAASVDGLLATAGLLAGGLFGILVTQGLGIGLTTGLALVVGSSVSGWMAPSIVSWWLITRDGQSLGKRWVDIRIETTQGELPGFVVGVVLRSWVTALGHQLCGLVGLLDSLAIFSKDRRTLHDHLAGTRVVRGRPPGR